MTNSSNELYNPIEEYGVIGDMRTAALVCRTGSIDFFCYPQFDSPTIFAALLDAEKGVRFSISLDNEAGTQRQLYLPSTNILLTRLHTPEALVEITDFMPIVTGSERGALVRRLAVVRGEATVKMRCAPRFDYARTSHRVVRKSDDEVQFIPDNSHEQRPLMLRASRPLSLEGSDAVSRFQVGEGETVNFVLFDPQSPPCGLGSLVASYCDQSFEDTAAYWQDWAGRIPLGGHWRGIVERSALVLKLLISAPHGSMVAAPTFGLPEKLGGERNWDYRYTWIRDAAFALYALLRLGFGQETKDFMRWLANRGLVSDEKGALQVLYRVDGGSDLDEKMLDHLEGYKGSSPVRIGNAAADQLQLDLYGGLIDAIYLSDKHVEKISDESWRNVLSIVGWVADNWHRPDEGIWEVRGGRHHFLHSRLMCWVAIDRALRIAMKNSFPVPLEKWRQERDAIYEEIHSEFWDSNQQSFVQRKGSTDLDASLLLMPLVKFISPRDPKWLSTMEAIENTLVHDALCRRYLPSGIDGLDGDEGAFTPCSFWYIECLSRAGQVKKARLLFEKMTGYANHLGLFSEELGACGEHLGNYPQALSHLALISAASRLERDLGPREGEFRL